MENAGDRTCERETNVGGGKIRWVTSIIGDQNASFHAEFGHLPPRGWMLISLGEKL